VRFGEEKAAAAESVTGLSPHTLMTIVRTCMYVTKTRRRLELPFSMHTEVAKLVPEDQDFYLSMAVEHRFTREQLRQAIKDQRHGYQEIASEPQWEAAEGMRRQLQVEEVAREIWGNARRAQPGNPYWLIGDTLMTRLGVALGEVKEEQT